VITTILVCINLYLTYRLAEFSGAITTKRNSVSDEKLQEMREKALNNKDRHNG